VNVSPAQTATAQLLLTVTEPLPKTIVTANADLLRNGIKVKVGEEVSIALSSSPALRYYPGFRSTDEWVAGGLPPGLQISQPGPMPDGKPIVPIQNLPMVQEQNEFEFGAGLPRTLALPLQLQPIPPYLPGGVISGSPETAGTYFASIIARGGKTEFSDPLNIRFVVTPATTPGGTTPGGTTPGGGTGGTPAQRSPWLLLQWELTDLHILVRSRAVESTLFEAGELRIKLGDALNFAVFFVDSSQAVFALAPTQLRMTIRKADNLDDLIIFKSAAPPTAVEQDGQTYYAMPITTGNREREVVLEWVEENGKNEPLKCVADLDWTKDGKLYSSRTFPVLLELDVTRP
jgi:hypothetical protein